MRPTSADEELAELLAVVRTTKRTSRIEHDLRRTSPSAMCRGIHRPVQRQTPVDMRSRQNTCFPARPTDVVAVWLDPRFHETLDLPDLSRPEVCRGIHDRYDVCRPASIRVHRHLDPVVRNCSASQAHLNPDLHFDMAMMRGRSHLGRRTDAKRLHGMPT